MSKPKKWKFEMLSEQSQKELMDELRALQIPWNKYQDARKTMTHNQAIQKLRRFRPPTVQEPVAPSAVHAPVMGESLKVLRGLLEGSRTAPQLFVVWAENGRSNGSAWIMANGRAHARLIAQRQWLSQARVTQVQPAADYIRDYEIDVDDPLDAPPKLEVGEFKEIEWGT